MQHRKSLNQSMLEHVSLQQPSGKTMASYAEQIGASRYKMQYWIRKYKARQVKPSIDMASKIASVL
jgi:GH24 family phage-related lysozyme (muramidase)